MDSNHWNVILGLDWLFENDATIKVKQGYMEAQGHMIPTEARKPIKQAAKAAIEAAQERQEAHYDKHHRRVEYNIGDLVMVYQPKRKEGRIKKLHRPWKGPFQISKKLGAVTYEVKSLTKHPFTDTFHVSKLKPYREGRDLTTEPADYSNVESESESDEEPDMSQDFILDRDDPSQGGEDVTGRRGSDLVGHGRDPENPPEDPISVEHSTEGRVTRGARPIGHNFPKRVWGR